MSINNLKLDEINENWCCWLRFYKQVEMDRIFESSGPIKKHADPNNK